MTKITIVAPPYAGPTFEWQDPIPVVLASWRRKTGELYLRHGYLWTTKDTNKKSKTYGAIGNIARFSEFDSEKRPGKIIQVPTAEGVVVNNLAWWYEPKKNSVYKKHMVTLRNKIITTFAQYEGEAIGRLQKELSAHETALIKMHIEEEVIISNDKN